MEGGLQGFAASGSADAQSLFWLAGGPVLLPEGHWYSQADFHQAGPDLLIATAEGDVYVVPGYFQEGTPPVLETVHGTVLNPQLVQALTDSPVSGQVAQIGVDGPGMIGADLGPGEPIGQVSELEGNVTVTRADGTQETLSAGDDIYQGDVLETGAESNVGLVFVDDTIFTLDEGGRMVMDEMVYDPGSQSGVFNAQVVQGVFSLVSGKIAKTAPDAMTLSTPELTIGIRGTTAAGEVPPGLFFPGGPPPGGPPPGGPPPGGPPPETKIMMMADVGGTVGELFVLPTNNPGAQPVVLNTVGAGIVSIGGGIVPRTFTQQEIQQTAGKAVTKLVKVVAVKAQQDAARATRQAEERGNQAQQAEQDAQQTEQQAQQAEEEAQQDQDAADALGAEAEAEAAQAEAELQEAQAIGDEQGVAEAAAKAAAAAAKAQVAAEIKATAEAKAAEAAALKAQAAAKAAEAVALQAEAQVAQQQAQQAQQFQQQATTAFTQQAQAFEQFTGQVVTDQLPPPDAGFGPNGPVPPGGTPPPDAQAPTAGTAGTVQDGPTPEEQAAMDAATKQAYEEALAAGATPEEAFNAAAMIASEGNMDDPAVDIARAAFEDALAQGLSAEEAMQAAQSAVQQYDMQISGTFDPNQPPPGGFDPNLPPPPDGFFDPNQPPPDGFFDPNQPPPDGSFDPNLPPPDMMVYDPMMMDPMFYDPMMMDPMFYDPMMDPYAMDPMFYDPMMDPYAMDPAMIDGFFYDPYMDPYAQFYDPYMIYDPFAYDQYLGMYDYFYDPFLDPNLTTQFGETIEAKASGGVLSGTALNTNFHFYWPTVLQGTAVINYTISDAGGTNQLSFDGMNSVTAKVTFGATSTSGTVTVYDGNNADTGTHYATITFSSISQFLLSDIQVAGFATDTFTDTAGGDVLVLSTLNANETGYAVAGTNDATESFTIDTTNYPNIKDAIFFGKGGADTFNVSIITGDLTLIGGITATDNKDDGTDYIPDSYLNTFTYAGTSYTAGSNGILANMGYGDVYVTDRASQKAFNHDLWDVAVFEGSKGNDKINVNGGYYNAIKGNTGDDTITVQQSVRFYTLDAGDGNDTVKITSSQLTYATSIAGGVGASDSLTIDSYTGGTIDLSTAVITGFESVSFNGNFSSSNAVSVTGSNVATSYVGSAFNDTFTGGTGNDTFNGGGGKDTFTGTGGSNTYVYSNATDSYPTNTDTITDFDAGTNGTAVDKIDISNFTLVNFSYVGVGGFSGGGDSSARFNANGASSTIQIDVNGDGSLTSSDLEIAVGSDVSANMDVGDFVTV